MHKSIRNLAECIISDAYSDLRHKKRKDSAIAFLTNPERVELWAQIINKSPERIARKAQYFYDNPEELPKLQGRGRKQKYAE
jgi:hypothetical protein